MTEPVQTEVKSNLSPVAQEVMPYMERLTERFRIRGLIGLANKLVRHELLKEVLNPQDKQDFNLVINDIKKEMEESLKEDDKGLRIVLNYLDAIEEINKE
ncbi:hypothetical protein M0P48_02455 [Candidatus Gracilibacteria bacterium]|jgi:hypothetical protein|nr:hypothetical protein [Candidatus Gracilibacteria bacterium]